MAARTDFNASSPAFVVDNESLRRNSGRQINWALVPDTFGGAVEYTIVATAIEPIGETSIAVAALPVAIPAGTLLLFEGTKPIYVTTDAAVGATALVASPIGTATAANDEATYTVAGTDEYKVIPGGTPMVEGGDGRIVPSFTAPTMLLWATADEGNRSDALTGYGVLVGGVIYDNLLPIETGDLAAVKAALVTAGCTFQYETYGDDRVV